MVDFALALSTVSQALKLANGLKEIEKLYNAAELKLKIAELITNLADLKITLVDARQDAAEKQMEIERLTNLFKRSAELVEFNGYKYDKDQDGKPRGHAYCPVCEQQGAFIHVATLLDEHQRCPKCQAHYTSQVF
jgi:hypothetical protein